MVLVMMSDEERGLRKSMVSMCQQSHKHFVALDSGRRCSNVHNVSPPIVY